MKLLKSIFQFFVKEIFPDPGEYNPVSNKFNIVKVLFVMALVVSVAFNFLLINRLYSLAERHLELTTTYLQLNYQCMPLSPPSNAPGVP